jgi:hypothetical protein
VGDALQRLNEVRDVLDAVFEQITDPLPAGKQFDRVLGVHKGRQHHDAGLRELLADRHGRREPFGRLTGWHPDVDHGKVGPLGADQGHEAARLPGLADNLESRPFQQPRYGLAQQHVVVSQHDPHRTAGIA